ncbi:MAG: T9SS type A sorting domain-containing protein [Lepagella sp.]
MGKDENDITRSYALKSANKGETWASCYSLYFPHLVPEGAVTCTACTNVMNYFIATDAGYIYKSAGNETWSAQELTIEDFEGEISYYTAMDFLRMDNDGADNNYGGIGFVCEDGSYGVLYTADAQYNLNSGTFYPATGVAGIPAYITHVGETFYMVTTNGHIQKSTDKCKSWTDCYYAEGLPFSKVVFNDENNGIAISDTVALITRNGGETWTVAVIEGGISPWDGEDDETANVWNDVAWNNNILVIAGNNGRCYISQDGGKSFQKEEIIGAESVENFTAISLYKDHLNILAQNGVFYYKTFQPNIAAFIPSVYDVENATWTPMTSFGVSSDRNVGSTWGISADGKYAAGIANIFDADASKNCYYAALWEDGQVRSLGSLFPGSATRANRVSDDGSVAVGFQDKMGPWMASVWRRQADGNYNQELLFLDPNKTMDDVDFDNFDSIIGSCLGNALAVSPNGEWVGGTGGSWYATNNAWIWNAENGVELIDAYGATVEVNNDGSMAVGRGDGGFGAWIWFRDRGNAIELNNYVAELEQITGGSENTVDAAICGFYAMSPNCRFLTGYAYDDEMNPHGYLVDLLPESSDTHRMMADQVKASVYPNPVVSELHVDLPYDSRSVKTSITLYDMQGGVCRRINDCRQSNVINVEGLTGGIYLLDVCTGNSNKTFKVIVK